MNLKRQSGVLLGGNMKTKIMLKYLYILCVVFCFFAAQIFAFNTTQYCEQETERLNKKYNDIAEKLKQERDGKVLEVVSKEGHIYECSSENETRTQIVVVVPTPLIKEIDKKFDERQKFLKILKEDEFKTVNWICQDK
jgi:hypothetical protein